MAIITDVDGTLLNGSTPILQVIDFVKANGEVLVVTARQESERPRTVADLRRIGVMPERLVMKDGDMPSAEFKRDAAEALLADYDIELAIDDDPANRRAFASLGIEAIDPASIPAPERNSHMATEIRTIAVDGIELRDHPDNGPGMSFRGYAAVFNSDSEPLPFIEQVAPGAFRRSLSARNNVRMLLNHDTSKVLGATRSKTLRLSEDSTGLLVDADLPPTSYGRDLSISMQRGDIESMSFGFSVPPKGDTWSEDGQRRTLTEVRLHEVSVVTFPAYPATTAAVRSVDALAVRCSEDAAMLEIAVEALLSAKQLPPDAAALLMSVISKMTAEEPVTAELSIESIPLALLQKQLELLAKA